MGLKGKQNSRTVLNMAPLKCCLNCILLNCSFHHLIFLFISKPFDFSSAVTPHFIIHHYTLSTIKPLSSSFSPWFSQILSFCVCSLRLILPWRPSCAALSAATCSTLLFQPLDLVKTRLQDPAEQHAPRVRHHQPTCLLWPSLTVSRHKPAVRLVSFSPDLCLVLDVKA